MTNLEKLKAEIAEMSAKEFAEQLYTFIGVKGFDEVCFYKTCPGCSCTECRVKWLNEEIETK